MDTRTGAIREVTEEEDQALRAEIKRGGRVHMVPVEVSMLEVLQKMRVDERIKWGRNERKRLRRAIRRAGDKHEHRNEDRVSDSDFFD